MKNKEEKVSIVVPVYNTSRYLEQCIKSILSQTYKNLEVLLIDDGSTDDSGVLCDSWARRDDRIMVYHKKNEGLGFTRNFGISKARGDYIFFVDSDDYLDVELIRKLVSLMRSEQAEGVKSGFIRFSENNKYNLNNYIDQLFFGKEQIDLLKEKFLGSLPKGGDSVEMGATATLYSLKIIKKYQIMFPSEREIISEDLVFNLSYLKHIKKFYVSSINGYYYRNTVTSLTRKYNKERFSKSLDLYRKIWTMLEADNLPQSAFMRLRKMLFINVRSCLSQEKPNISMNDRRTILSNIKTICKNTDVQNAILVYPINQMKIRQRIFLRLVKNQKVTTLYVLLKLNLL